MPLRIAADGLAFRPGTLWPEMKGPGLKPYRFGLGFRGMNAPAPSERTNNGKGGRLGWRRLLKNEDAPAWKMLWPKGNPAAKLICIIIIIAFSRDMKGCGCGWWSARFFDSHPSQRARRMEQPAKRHLRCQIKNPR